MNRFLAVLAVAFLFPLFSLAQDGFRDVIYLKKGGFVKGAIIEQVPHKSVKLLLQDGMVASFKVEEIEKFSKERFVDEIVEKRPRKSYIGLTAGLSIPIGKYADKSGAAATLGIQVNMLQIGYLFTAKWGIASTFFSTRNDYKSNITRSTTLLNSNKWNVESFDGAMIGPLYSHPLSKSLNLDISIMGGYTKFSLIEKTLFTQPWSGQDIPITYTSDAYAASVRAGVIIRYNISRFISAMACADYFSSKPRFESNERQPVNTISLGVGLAFRIPSAKMEHVAFTPF
jgi:hypothetical protein